MDTWEEIEARISFEDKPARVVILAKAIGKAAFGDWGATGYQIREVLIKAAEAALLSMYQSGYDLTLLDTSEDPSA